MARTRQVPLLVGSYSTQSVIASAQRCVNLYMEGNPRDSKFPTTHYLTPGLTLAGAQASPTGGWRQMFVTSAGQLLGVNGSQVCNITGTPGAGGLTSTPIGSINSLSGCASIADNGTNAIVVDGSPTGAWVNLETLDLTPVNDPAFYGSTRADEVDGYFVLNMPQSREFYISLFQQNAFDSLDFASKNGYSDPLGAAMVTRRNIYLFGQQTTEVWYNTGAANFTFARIDGIFIQHGCAAPGSLAQMDGSIFFLTLDPQGAAMVMRTQGFEAMKISTFALDFALQQYGTISDAVGYTYQRNGHMFYVLSFPTADATWVYDLATGQWHEWVSIDSNGQEHRHRAGAMAYWNGAHICGDYANGNLYILDGNNATENGSPIVRRRGFPHMMDGGNRVFHRQFIADFAVGSPQSTYVPGDTDVFLRWSDNKGQSYGNPIRQTFGDLGHYLTQVQWQRLGIARDRVFELFWSNPNITALNGAFVESVPADT